MRTMLRKVPHIEQEISKDESKIESFFRTNSLFEIFIEVGDYTPLSTNENSG
jgi:hypothetical protein